MSFNLCPIKHFQLSQASSLSGYSACKEERISCDTFLSKLFAVAQGEGVHSNNSLEKLRNELLQAILRDIENDWGADFDPMLRLSAISLVFQLVTYEGLDPQGKCNAKRSAIKCNRLHSTLKGFILGHSGDEQEIGLRFTGALVEGCNKSDLSILLNNAMPLVLLECLKPGLDTDLCFASLEIIRSLISRTSSSLCGANPLDNMFEVGICNFYRLGQVHPPPPCALVFSLSWAQFAAALNPD